MNKGFDKMNFSSEAAKKEYSAKYNERPTFLFNNDKNHPIRAGGVLFYRTSDKGVSEILLIKSADYPDYQDIGGKTDMKDKNIFETIAREVDEETNKQIKFSVVMKQMKNSPSIYVRSIRYLLYLVEANDKQCALTTADFADKEYHDNFYRKISWMNIDNYIVGNHDEFIFNARMDINKLQDSQNILTFDKENISGMDERLQNLLFLNNKK